MADIKTIMRTFRVPNPNFEELTELKVETEKQYEQLLKFQGRTDAFDDVLNQIKQGLDNWKISEYKFTVNQAEYDEVKDLLTKIIGRLEENSNFQIH